MRRSPTTLEKHGPLVGLNGKANSEIFITFVLFYLFCFVLFQQFVRRQSSHGRSVSRGDTDVCNKGLLKFGSVAAVVDTRLPLMMG